VGKLASRRVVLRRVSRRLGRVVGRSLLLHGGRKGVSLVNNGAR
jgi:hypothetical protein